jgi:hypothetical protein
LINYFKNNIILLNNVVELSENIITKNDDLELLIALLIEVKVENVEIEIEEVDIKNSCGNTINKLPRYRKINDIIINKKQTFKGSYEQYHIQMKSIYNISLEYVLL